MRFSNQYGFYELNAFPGCSALVVSNHAFIYPKFRGQGKGQEQHVERLAKAKELGYAAIICTVKADNKVEKHILDKNGWSTTIKFWNIETKSWLETWIREL